MHVFISGCSRLLHDNITVLQCITISGFASIVHFTNKYRFNSKGNAIGKDKLLTMKSGFVSMREFPSNGIRYSLCFARTFGMKTAIISKEMI